MQVTVDEKRNFNLLYNKNENTSVAPQIVSEAKNDKAELTQSASLLTSLPINLPGLSFVEEGSNFSFDFTFSENRFRNISASGFYSSKERNLSFNLSFIIDKEFYEGEQKKTKQYQVDFSINSSNLEIKSLNKRVEKENIYDFLSRVMNDLTKMINSDKINVTGIIFDKEDLAELLGLGDKEIGKLLQEIMLIIKAIADIKKNKNPDAENVLFTPKRISKKIAEYNQTNTATIDMNLSVKEISNSE
ncbi:MAG: hypothetical protein PVH88_17380 [Ignavibacteria bacterium]|jgi:hypothetical protein